MEQLESSKWKTEGEAKPRKIVLCSNPDGSCSFALLQIWSLGFCFSCNTVQVVNRNKQQTENTHKKDLGTRRIYLANIRSIFDLWKMLTEKLADSSHLCPQRKFECLLNFPLMHMLSGYIGAFGECPASCAWGGSAKLAKYLCQPRDLLICPTTRPPFLTSSRIDGFPMRARAVDNFLLVP